MTLKSRTVLLRRLGNVWSWIDNNSAVLVLGLAITTFLSAFFGIVFNFWIPQSDLDKAPEIAPGYFNWFTDSLYEAAQSIFLNMESHRDNFNFLIGLARITAVLLVALVATQAIGQLFKDSVANLRLRFGGKRNVFVGGLGRIGFQLAAEYADQGKLVVVLEIAEPNYWTQAAEDAFAIVLKGDVTDISSLREHIFRDPMTIHLVTGNDLANINALANVRQLRREYETRFGKPLGAADCYVHIADPGLQCTLNRCIIESSCGSDHSLNIHVFNIYHETACQLIIEHLTPLRPRECDEVALYIVFGFGQMGTAMVKELAEYAHFENQKRSRILVLTKNAEFECDKCLAQWSRLSPHFVHSSLSEVTFDSRSDEWTSQVSRPKIAEPHEANPSAVEYVANVHFCEMKSTEVLSMAEVDQLVRLATEANVRPAVMFCFEEDEMNFKLASALNDVLQDFHGINCNFGPNGKIAEDKKAMHQRNTEFYLPIFAFLPCSRPLREIMAESTADFPIQAFGAVHEGLSRALDDVIEQVAMDISWSFDAVKKRNEAESKSKHNQPVPSDAELGIVPRDKYLKVWRSKSYWEQHSNLTAAEHMWIKVQMLGLRMINCKATAPEAQETRDSYAYFDSISQENKVLLALVEHNRWMAERLLLGWSFGKRSEQPPRRLSLCPKQNLAVDELEKDFDQIKIIVQHFLQHKVRFEKIE